MTKGTLRVFFIIAAVLVAGCFNNSTNSETNGHIKVECLYRLPEHTLRLTVHGAGTNGRVPDKLIISVAPEHKDWLVTQLTTNKGVSRFNDISTSKSDGVISVIHDYRYHVYLTDRIGQDDFDALVDLPRSLDEHIGPQDDR